MTTNVMVLFFYDMMPFFPQTLMYISAQRGKACLPQSEMSRHVILRILEKYMMVILYQKETASFDKFL